DSIPARISRYPHVPRCMKSGQPTDETVRDSMTHSVHQIRKWRVLLGGLLIASVLALTALRYACIRIPQESFNPTLWQSGSSEEPTKRQSMIRDLLNNVLPGKHRRSIEQLLGPSPTHAEMRRHRMEDLELQGRDDLGESKPFPRTGQGHYFDEFGWDLIYV